MKKEINNTILLADFSRDYNAFRWIYSVFFTLIGSVALLIFLIYVLKMSGFKDSDLGWIPLFNVSSFPYEGRLMEFISTGVLFILGASLIYAAGVYFFKGKIVKVVYDTNSKVIRSIRNGAIQHTKELPISSIKYLRKKKGKRSPSSISTGQLRVQTISLQMNRAFAVLKDTNEYVLLFEYYDKKKFDETFRDINKFIKEKKAE